jgi:Tfp pilus assembly protein PilO
MIPKGLFTQIILLIVSFAIIPTFIKPTFSSIAETQDKIARYQDERAKVQEVNLQLNQQLEVLESISATDHRKLLVYMPDQVDPIAVMRALKVMTDQSGLIFNDVTPESMDETQTRPSRRTNTEASAQKEDDGTKAYQYPFTLNVKGSYGQIKNLISTIEQNEYPLEVHGLDIIGSEGGLLEANMRVVTYSHQPPMESETSYE